MLAPLLDVKGLRVLLPVRTGVATIVDRVDFSISRRQIFGIAGESGSGKTMSALSLMGLAPRHAVIEGTAIIDGKNLFTLPPDTRRKMRGRDIAMVFQNPMTSLHPMIKIGRQLTEHARHHLGLSRRAAAARAIELLNEVRLPDPQGVMRGYAHQYSGGMRQRIAIAMALVCEPRILIADEPTTALDVTVQASILRLLDRLRTRHNLTVILITHDLGVMSAVADHLTVMYAGRVVESGPTKDILRQPGHPYTAALLASLPTKNAAQNSDLVPIPGLPASPADRPSGCAFHPRCGYADESCARTMQELRSVDVNHTRSIACTVNPLLRRSAPERSS